MFFYKIKQDKIFWWLCTGYLMMCVVVLCWESGKEVKAWCWHYHIISLSFAIFCKNNHFPVDVFSISFHFLHIVMWTCWIFYNTTLHSTQNTPRASKINIQFSCCAAFKRLLKVHFKFNLSLFMTLNFSSNKAKKIKAEKITVILNCIAGG